jgi:PhoH-like ATPase
VSRFLDELSKYSDPQRIEEGIPLPGPEGGSQGGRLFFQTRIYPESLPATLPGNRPDNTLLGTALALRKAYSSTPITLVSKDINLRIKAHILGIHAEDYYNDQVLEDAELLYTGMLELPQDFWDRYQTTVQVCQQNGRNLYVLDQAVAQYPNQCLYINSERPFEAIVREVTADRTVLEVARDFRSGRNTVWGISARNREQNFALNLLMDPEVDFVTLLGQAGTGKTLLALAAGLTQTLEDKLYREIVVTRVTVPVGEDIGFLPGTEEEKMTPWMGALMDNLEVLTHTEVGNSWGRAATQDLLHSRIKIRSLNFMRGRTFLNRYIIIDEAQNLTPKQIKTLITRAGPGTKVVCLGNIAQIDTPYLSETTSGLTYTVDHFKEWQHSGHITLLRGERSRLADFAGEVL